MTDGIIKNKKGQVSLGVTSIPPSGLSLKMGDIFLKLWISLGIPLTAMALFLLFWSAGAARVHTSLGTLPGPQAVFVQAGTLWQEHWEEKGKEKEFYLKQQQQNVEKSAQDSGYKSKVRKYTGKSTYIDQIITSLFTVFTGFVIASLIAIPIGIICGLNRIVMIALNPLIQIFKPVSPLAWLPLVTMIVSAVYTTQNGGVEKCFIISAITVSLCSLWPTLINTAQGVSSIDKDIINVSRVLNLGWFTHVFKIVLPSSLPLIFTGLRISLGVGWMVLIASEMLAQNPGLGKFVWDEFQNGSSNSLARIMVAIWTIGVIGFILDRLMVLLQKTVNFQK